MDATPDADLAHKEKQLALSLKASCNKDGEETDLIKSSGVFLQLGEVYKEKFSRNSDLTTARFDALRSAALYQAAFERSESCFKQDHDKLLSLYSAIFSAIRVPDNSTMMESIIATSRQEFQDMRATVHKKFRQISNPFKDEQQVNKSIKIEFYESVESYQKFVNDSFIEMMSKIFKKCSSILGEPPCSFALLGLGSLAKFEVTPFSDFESILVLQNNVEVDETMMNYFRNYAMLAQLVVIGLGETILPAMSIKSLNDFETDGGDWFVDVVTKRGLSFDGLLPHACKNPLGRLPTAKKPWHTELIQTVDNMLSFVDEEIDLKEGYHLADIISHSVFVAGGDKEGQPTGNEVAAHFHELVWAKTVQKKESQNAIDKLIDTLQDDIAKYSFKKQKHGQAVHVKKDLYRGITILLPQLAMLVGLRKNSSYDIIQGLYEEKLIDNNFCFDLKTAVAIANYARANTYFKKGAQSDVLAGGNSYAELKGTDVLESISISALHFLFCVGAEFQKSLMISFDSNHQISPLKRTAETFSFGSVLFRFEQYDRAINWFQQQLNRVSGNQEYVDVQFSNIHLMLGRCYYSMDQHENACHHFVKAEKYCQENMEFERGQILLFRALAERKLRGVDTTNTLMKEAYDCLKKSKPTDTEAYDIESLQMNLQELCRENSDLVPELIEVMVITGDRLLQESKAPFLALSQYLSAIYEMEIYYKDGRHVLRSLYVKEKVAICEGQLGRFVSAAQTWIEFAKRSKTMPCGAAADVSFRPGFDPVEALLKNTSLIKKTFCSTENLDNAMNVSSQFVKIIDVWSVRESSDIRLRRFRGKMNMMLGELYEKDRQYDLAIKHYEVTKIIFAELYPTSHRAVTERLISCYKKSGIHIKELQNLRGVTKEREGPSHLRDLLNVLNSSLSFYRDSQCDNLFSEILKTVELVLNIFKRSGNNFENMMSFLYRLFDELTPENATQVLEILANSVYLLQPHSAKEFLTLVENATNRAHSNMDMNEFSRFLIPFVVETTRNFPRFVFNVQTSFVVRTILCEDKISKTIEENYFLTAVLFKRFRKVDDALEMLEPLPVVDKTTLMLRLEAAECLARARRFSDAILAYNLTLAGLDNISTISTKDKYSMLADVMLGMTSVWIQQNEADTAKKYFENVLQYIELLLQSDREDCSKKYPTKLFSIAQEIFLRNSRHIFLEYRNLLLNGDSYTVLRPTNLSQLHTLLLFTYPPHDGLTKVDRLLEILRNASESCELANCSNSLVNRTDVVSFLMERIFAIPTEISSEVDLVPLVDALRSVCADEVVGFAKVPPIREVIKFLANLSKSLSWDQVVKSALNSANIYTKKGRSKDAEQCLCGCKDILKLAGEDSGDNKILWYKAKCSIELSLCRRKLGKTDKAWTHLTSAMKVSLPLAVDESHHQILTQRALELESRSVAQWDETVSYMTDLLTPCNIYTTDILALC